MVCGVNSASRPKKIYLCLVRKVDSGRDREKSAAVRQLDLTEWKSVTQKTMLIDFQVMLTSLSTSSRSDCRTTIQTAKDIRYTNGIVDKIKKLQTKKGSSMLDSAPLHYLLFARRPE